MLIVGATERHISKALESVRQKFGENVTYNKFTRIHDTRFRVTLRVKDSKGTGARVSTSGRRMVSACWHVHGEFIDALPAGTRVYTGGNWTTPGSDWHDWNAGSQMYPKFMSELCDCG